MKRAEEGSEINPVDGLYHNDDEHTEAYPKGNRDFATGENVRGVNNYAKIKKQHTSAKKNSVKDARKTALKSSHKDLDDQDGDDELIKKLNRKHKHHHKHHHAQKNDEKEDDEASVKEAQNEEVEQFKKKGEKDFMDAHVNVYDGLYHSPDGSRHFHSTTG